MNNSLIQEAREANEAMPLYDECEYAIWSRAINVQQHYGRTEAMELLRRLADELEVLP